MPTPEVDSCVSKSNAMNQMTAYKQRSPLSETEQMVALAIVSKISPEDRDFQSYRVTPAELSRLTGIAANHLSGKRIDDICVNLMTTAFTIRNSKEVIHVPFFTEARRVVETGTIFFQFSPRLKPYLLDLKDNFTSYRINVIASISGAHSKRFYELLVQWRSYHKPWVVKLDELKEMLFIDKKRHQRFDSFKRIIVQAQSEINRKSDIEITWKPITNGRKVTSLEFLIRSKPKSQSEFDRVEADFDLRRSKIVHTCHDVNMFDKLQAVVPSLSDDQTVFVINNHSKELVMESLIGLMMATAQNTITTTPAKYLMGILKNKRQEDLETSAKTRKSTLEKLTDCSWMEGMSVEEMEDWE